MKIKATHEVDASVQDLARAMAEDPEAFAEFWRAFSRHIADERIDVAAFADNLHAKFDRSVGSGKETLAAIVDLMRAKDLHRISLTSRRPMQETKSS